MSGCELFHIDDLHAKVMLSDDFISIGSQNLTNKGKSNLEASFCSNDKSFIKYSRSEVECWVGLAKEITLEMIEDMEDEISPLIIEYGKIKKLLNAVDESVIEKENIRQKLEEDRIRKILEDKERLRQLAINARNIKQSSRSIFANVQKITNQGRYGDKTNTFSLVPYKGKGSFLSWQVGTEEITLKRQRRYLFMDTDSGRIGWARVNKGRITYFESSVSRVEEASIGDWRCKLNFESNWSETQSEHNLTIGIKYLNTNIKLVYDCHFDLKFITNISLNTQKSQNHLKAEEMKLWNEINSIEFSDSIAYYIFSPFLYNKKLTGKQPNEFFIQPRNGRKISLGLINRFPILLSKLNK